VVLFTSDHGDYLGDHGRLRKSHQAAEQLLHVPCILRVPGDHPTNSSVSRLDNATSNIDILPTLLESAGVELPRHIQGSSLLAVGEVSRYALAHGFDGMPEGANFTILDERFRYTLYPENSGKELFDHSVDPLESRNLADDSGYAAELRRLHAALAEAQLRAVNPVSGRLASW
jgi:arylsulfatase A-like enzyme